MPPPLGGVPALPAGPALIRVSTAVGARMLEARRRSGLSAAQLQVLRLALTGCGVRSVVERLGTPKSTVTSVVDQLAASGLLTRAADPADRRRQVIAATPRGRRLLARFDADLAARVMALVFAVPTTRRARLTALLTRLPDQAFPVA